jgi:hypothetical protein
MNELIAKMQPGEFIGLVAIVSGVLAGIIIPSVLIVTLYLRNSRRDSMEYDLKREMLDRGMSADDIERVIRVGVTEMEQSPWTHWSKAASNWGCAKGKSVGATR